MKQKRSVRIALGKQIYKKSNNWKNCIWTWTYNIFYFCLIPGPRRKCDDAILRNRDIVRQEAQSIVVVFLCASLHSIRGPCSLARKVVQYLISGEHIVFLLTFHKQIFWMPWYYSLIAFWYYELLRYYRSVLWSLFDQGELFSIVITFRSIRNIFFSSLVILYFILYVTFYLTFLLLLMKLKKLFVTETKSPWWRHVVTWPFMQMRAQLYDNVLT